LKEEVGCRERRRKKRKKRKKRRRNRLPEAERKRERVVQCRRSCEEKKEEGVGFVK
jgi:hypothetical protein